MLGGRVLDDAVEGAGAVEPGYDGESPGDGGGLEPADLLDPPDSGSSSDKHVIENVDGPALAP